MLDLDSELLDNQEHDFKSQEQEYSNAENTADKSYKGIDNRLLGFQQDGIIENKFGDDNNEPIFTKFTRHKSKTQYVKGTPEGNSSKSTANQSILSSKPPLLETIKNNFDQILNLKSQWSNSNDEKSEEGNILTSILKKSGSNESPTSDKNSDISSPNVLSAPKPPIVPKSGILGKPGSPSKFSNTGLTGSLKAKLAQNMKKCKILVFLNLLSTFYFLFLNYIVHSPKGMKKVKILSHKSIENKGPHASIDTSGMLRTPQVDNNWAGLVQLHMEHSDRLIDSLEDFFSVAGFEIYNEEGEEIHLKVKSTNKIIKVCRSLFKQKANCSHSNISIGDEKGGEQDADYNIMINTAHPEVKGNVGSRNSNASVNKEGKFSIRFFKFS